MPPSNFLDLPGQHFGHLTVIKRTTGPRRWHVYWECLCACGTTTVVETTHLRQGDTTSCGCQSSRHTSKANDLTGQPFGRLRVIERAPNGPGWKARWTCQCECGNVVIIPAAHLTKGNTQSCGCLRKERQREANITHGLTDSPEYAVFCTMKARCTNPNNEKYPLYGGRGIRVEWETFEQFFADMGPRPGPEYTIERLSTDGNYSKDNCVWATQEVQQNNRRNNTYVMHEGQRYTVPQLARHLGINRGTLWSRLRKQGLI